MISYTMNFGQALAELKVNRKVTRLSWNGKDIWLRYIDFYNDKEFSLKESGDSIGTWLPFIVMKTVDNKLVPWSSSQTDILATDWIIIE